MRFTSPTRIVIQNTTAVLPNQAGTFADDLPPPRGHDRRSTRD